MSDVTPTGGQLCVRGILQQTVREALLVVPVVQGGPRGRRRPPFQAKAVTAAGGPCGPTGSPRDARLDHRAGGLQKAGGLARTPALGFILSKSIMTPGGQQAPDLKVAQGVKATNGRGSALAEVSWLRLVKTTEL